MNSVINEILNRLHSNLSKKALIKKRMRMAGLRLHYPTFTRVQESNTGLCARLFKKAKEKMAQMSQYPIPDLVVMSEIIDGK